MLESLRRASTWRLHTKDYNFQWYPLPNNSSSEYRTSPKLKHVVHLLLFYDILFPDSIYWMVSDFIFHLRDNKQLLDEVFVISRIIEVEVGVISRSRRLRLITLTETSIILNITKTESNNCFIIHWTEKIEVIFFASSLTPSSTKRANLTWLLLEIMHRGHTWHDYPWPWHDYSWPWHDYCIICKFWRHGRWFRKFTVGFRPIKKELESWMYNN